VRVLVVDDDASVAKLFSTVLEKAGHDVAVVSDGADALERVEREHFDAVVCDWMLPTLDGTTVIRELRKRPGRQHAIVLTSCAVGQAVRTHAARAGADEFLAKPAAAAAIVASIASAVEKRARSRLMVHPIAGTAAWTGLVALVADKLQECTGLVFEATAAGAVEHPHHAVLDMLDVARDSEVRVALFAQHEMGLDLAKAMVGVDTPDDAMIAEALAELCNNICGALKTATRADGYAFTLGLPTFEVPSSAAVERSFQVGTRCSFQCRGRRIEALVGVQAAPVLSVPTADLAESMVLAEDVHNTAGLLVAAKGTRLTALTAERIGRHAPKRLVRVCSLKPSWPGAPADRSGTSAGS